MSSILDNKEKIVMIGNYQPNIGSPFISYIMRISDSTTTEINEVSNSNSILIYPNPSNGYLTVLLKNLNSSVQSIEVYSISGKMIYNKNVEQDNFSMLDLTILDGGVYILKIKLIKSEASYVKRIVIMK